MKIKLFISIFLLLFFVKIYAEESLSNWKLDIKNSLHVEKFPNIPKTDNEYNTKSLSLLKLENNIKINSNFTLEIGLYEEMSSFSGNINDKILNNTKIQFPFYRRFNLSRVQLERENITLKNEISLLNFIFNYKKFNIYLGRQIILSEHSFFWNPTNWLGTIECGTVGNKNKLNCKDGLCSVMSNATENYLDPNKLQDRYSSSVDAVRVCYIQSPSSKFEIISAFGQKDTKFVNMQIAKTNFRLKDIDMDVLVGILKEEKRFGLGLNKNFDNFEITSDISLTSPKDEKSFVLGSAGTSYKLSGLSKINTEFYFNGFGEDDIEKYDEKILQERIILGEINNISKYYFAMKYRYEFNNKLCAEIPLIYNIVDKSNLSGIQTTFSVNENVKFRAGALIANGKKSQDDQLLSEFGTYPDNYYIQYEIGF